MSKPQPPTEIHLPRLRALRMVRMRSSRSANRASACFTMSVESQMSKQWHRLLLEDPIWMADELRPADEAALRAFFVNDQCSLVNVFLEQRRAEFLKQDGSIIGTVGCQSCEVETPAIETA